MGKKMDVATKHDGATKKRGGVKPNGDPVVESLGEVQQPIRATVEDHVGKGTNGDAAQPVLSAKSSAKKKKAVRQRRFSRTDAGNAELFAHLYGESVRYDHRRTRWLIWRKHWWAEDVSGGVYQLAKRGARYRLGCAMDIKDGDERKKEIWWALKSESRQGIDAMLHLARTESPLSDGGDNWDSNPWLLGAKNGVIDLRTGTLRPGSPSDKITIHTDIAFDPHAKAPRWEEFLNQIFGGDQELISFVQRAVGYSVSGGAEEQCIFLCYGTGANGKSTCFEALRYALGGYAYNLPFSAFELKARSSIPNDVAALVGKRFVTAVETSESVQLNEARIKALTGGDEVTARFLYREFFPFSPQAKFFLAFNHKPLVADDSPGFWRRVRLIPFLREFKEGTADKDLLSKLKAEAPGILAWAVQGCLEWQKKGLGLPPVVKQATEAYREESDPLADFITERCNVDPAAWVAAGTLWKAYQQWATNNGEPRPLDRRAFSRRLEARGFDKRRQGHDRTWIWIGLSLRTDPLDPPDVPPAGVRADADVNSDIVVHKPERTM